MNKKLLTVLMFTVGATIGSAVTWKLVKTKYEQIADDEIASVRDEYKDLMIKMKKNLQDSVEYEEPQEDEEDNEDEEYPDDDERDFAEKEREQVEYYRMTSKYRSARDEESDDEDNEEGGKWDQNEDEVPYINGPYVITPEDFSSSPPGYNAQPLNYFTDGILADDWGAILDLDETIGDDAVNHFGEYVDDIVYIRNERNEIDYEVTKDPRTYQDMLRTNPDPYYGKYAD